MSPRLTDIESAINYNEIFEELMQLYLTIYTPTQFISPSKAAKYSELYEDNKVNTGFTQKNREKGIRQLMAINLMKRMESSVGLTIKRMIKLVSDTVRIINDYDEKSNVKLDLNDMSNTEEFDFENQSDDLFSFGKKIKIELGDMDYKSWKDSLAHDLEILEIPSIMVRDSIPSMTPN